MTRGLEPKVGVYATVSAAGVLAALVLGRPELAGAAAPFALAVAWSLALARAPDVDLSVALERDRTLEGEELDLTLVAEAGARRERFELLVRLPWGLELAGRPDSLLVELGPCERRELVLTVSCRRFGGYTVGETLLRARDRLGFVSFEERYERPLPLKVFPRAEALARLAAPLETQAFTGDRVARVKGDGVEFADVRPFVPGDVIRRVDWRTTARRGALHVSDRHPERNADVILFLDSFADLRADGDATLDEAVRAATALASAYLEHRDRVGLVGFGGLLRWLVPGTGLAQLYRIVDSLLDTEVVFSYAWKEIAVIPPRTLPPKALVLAITPLLDERAVAALLDLRARGFDLAVVEVSPVDYVSPGAGTAGELAYRLWRLRRDALRLRYEALGVPVAEWNRGAPLAEAIEGVRSFRRGTRALSA